LYIKNIERNNGSGLLDEIEGVIQGHRDGHGYVVRDDGEADIYLPPNEMRAVLHRDRVRARIVRHDRKGRPEGRVVEIIERPPHPIIGRLLHESGVWLVAPEDKRYDPQGRHGPREGGAGRGGRTDRAAQPLRPAGRPREGSAGRG
jgi:ribonuclease R